MLSSIVMTALKFSELFDARDGLSKAACWNGEYYFIRFIFHLYRSTESPGNYMV